MSLVTTVFVDHPKLVIFASVAILIALLGVVVYRAGERKQAGADAIQVLDIQRRADSSATIEAQRAVTAEKHAADSTHTENLRLTERVDSLTRVAVSRETAAVKVRSRMTLTADTATLSTDSGSVKYSLPMPVAKQFADERASTDLAYSALSHRADSLASLDSGRVREIEQKDLVIALDTIATQRLNAQLATANKEIEALKAQTKPRFSFSEGLAVGGGIALTVVSFLVVAF